MTRSESSGEAMLGTVDRLFTWTRARPFFYRFVLFTRILLAAAFIPTGMVKLLGERFTLIPPDQPIGAFFEAIYNTGLYWRFLGLGQVSAGVLVLIPPLAHLGAAIFLPIIINIFVVTVALNFTGTPFVTGPMVLAAAALCLWDYHRFRPMLSETPARLVVTRHALDRWERAGFGIFATCLLCFFGFTRSFMPREAVPVLVVGGVAGGLLALARFVWLASTGRTRTLFGPAASP